MNDINIYDNDNNYVGTIHVFQDDSGTELNSVVVIDGEMYHEPLEPFCYISDKQLSISEINQFINNNKKEIIEALNNLT